MIEATWHTLRTHFSLIHWRRLLLATVILMTLIGLQLAAFAWSNWFGFMFLMVMGLVAYRFRARD